MEDWNKLRDRVARYQARDLRAEIVRVVNSKTVKHYEISAGHQATCHQRC